MRPKEQQYGVAHVTQCGLPVCRLWSGASCKVHLGLAFVCTTQPALHSLHYTESTLMSTCNQYTSCWPLG